VNRERGKRGHKPDKEIRGEKEEGTLGVKNRYWKPGKKKCPHGSDRVEEIGGKKE